MTRIPIKESGRKKIRRTITSIELIHTAVLALRDRLIGLKARKPPTTSPLPPHEWEMKNFSPKFRAPSLEEQIQGRKGEGKESIQEDKEEEEEEEERARCEWDFILSTIVSSGAAGAGSDTLGVIEFDPSDSFIATGGIARKIRIYSLRSLLPHESNPGEHGNIATISLDHASVYDFCICTPAKLSSLKWKPGSGGRVLGSGDYDGVVMEYDLETKAPIFERDEHGGRRVWSMDYMRWDPVTGASGSDDGTMQMWDSRCEGGKCVASVQPSGRRSPVCCVEFNPVGGPLVAVGCADRRAYAYDVRKMGDPVVVFDGHGKTVTYVRFLDTHTMVSAGTDGCLKLWNINDAHVIRTYRGHVNSRSFVGLSVWRNGGLLGCGSESNQVFVYDRRWSEPIWVHGFEAVTRAVCDHGFVSSVCWRQIGEDRCNLVAGGSDGVLQVFLGKRKNI